MFIDPVRLAEAALAELPRPSAILLTASWHQRAAWRCRRHFGAEIWLPGASIKQLESRVASISGARGAKRQLVVDCIRRSPPTFRIGDLIAAHSCTGGYARHDCPQAFQA